jgi:hypothetical protein
MPIRNINKVRSVNREINQVQENVDQFAKQFTDKEFLDSLLIKNITLTAGSVNELNHTLGRELQGWIPVRVRADSRIWDTQDSNTRSTLTLLLNVSATVTIDLLVF